MRFLFLILLATALASTLKPSMKNALRNKVITDFKNSIVPIIYKQIAHLKLPDIHTKKDGFKISVSHIHVDIAVFHGNQISITFVPNTSTIKFAGSGFGMKGGAHIHAKWHFISKSMNADVHISHAGFSTEISLISNAGKPNIKVKHLHISLSSHHVSIHIHGGIINKILEFLVGLLKGHFVSQIVHQLQSKVPSLLTHEVNKKLNTLPSDISIGQNLVIKYGFPYAPFVRHDYLFTGITAYIHPKNNPNPPPYHPPNLPEFDPHNSKGIQFFLADYVVKSSIESCYKLGYLTVAFEKDMLDHHVKMSCKATKVPGFAFNNAIDVLLDASCDVIFDRNSKNRFTLITELHVNLKEYIKKAIIYFSVGTIKINKLEYHQTHPVDIEWFKKGINKVFEVVKEIVNGEMGHKGIPLPSVHGIDYKDTSQTVKKGYMEICMNPVFHFTSEEEESQ